MIDRGDGPRQANAQEYVDCIAARHIANAIVSGLILFGRDDAGECICRPRNTKLNNWFAE